MHHSPASIQYDLGGPVALLLLTLLLIGFPCSEADRSSLATSASELLSSLRDHDVTRITLGAGVFRLDSATLNSGGLVIGPNRHVVIAGNASAITEPNSGVHGRLSDRAFRYASGIVFGSTAAAFFKLSDNTTLGFQDLILINGLSQLGYDWQVVTLQQPKAARANVEFLRTVKVRDGCLPQQIFVQHITSYSRLGDVPGQQAASVQPFCYRAPADLTASLEPLPVGGSVGTNATASDNITCVAETLAIADLATFITRSNGQSYRLYEQNSTYWCRAYVSMSCLSASGPEQCVKDLLAAVGNDTTTNSTNTNTSPPPPPESKGDKKGLTSVLLPALLTGFLALAFIAATMWCIYRRGGEAHRGSSLGALARAGAGAGADVERGARGRVGDALARLLPGGHSREANRRKPYVPGYVPVVSKEALDRIAKVRAELSSKMVVASSDDDLSDVRNLHLVGKGTFGRVYKGEWKGVTVALKVISVPVSQYGQAQWQHVLGEAAISTLLNHPCVLQTYSVALLEYAPARKAPSSTSDEGGNSGNNNPVIPATAVVAANTSGEAPIDTQQQQLQLLDDMAPFYQLKMVSEFCEGGSVVNALKRMQFYDSVGGGAVRMPAIIDIASQVASGMAYLHSANIIHADLKAANVLLKQQPGSGRLQAKVADFGLSFRLDEPEATHVTKGQLGSITHMAPEVLVHGRVSKSSDVYSFGILLYELYTGQQAYWDIPQPMLAYHVATAGGRPVLPSHCPAAYRGVAKACWSSEPASRPTFTEVYNSLQTIAGTFQRHLSDHELPIDADQQVPPPTAAQQDPAAASVTLIASVAVLSYPLSSDPAALHPPVDGRIAPPPSNSPSLSLLATVRQPAGTPTLLSDDDLRPQMAAACDLHAAGDAGAFPISDLCRLTQGPGEPSPPPPQQQQPGP